MSDEICTEIKAAAKALCHYSSGPSSVNSCCQGIGRCEMDAATAEIIRLRAALAAARRDGMEGFGDLVAAAHAEATKAMQKYPQPNYVISKIAEEAGEVVKAAIHCAEKRETAENVAGEMKQLIAMLIRLWVEGDQVHGLPPIAAAIRTTAGKGKP